MSKTKMDRLDPAPVHMSRGLFEGKGKFSTGTRACVPVLEHAWKLRFGSKVLFLLWRCFAKNEIRFKAAPH